MAEKPLAMDLPAARRGYSRPRRRPRRPPISHAYDADHVPALAAVQQVVRAGAIGDPLLSFSQKTYRWGTTRPDFYRDRKTFPGLAPWIGIHAFDWLHWILGDVFTEVQGREGTTARPDYPACGSQAAFVLTMRNGGMATVTLDYLRPASAPTHADERLRIAGTHEVFETALVERKRSRSITEEQAATTRCP